MEGTSPQTRDYAELWRAAEKVVYSTTLTEVTTSRTRLERAFEPDAVRALKADAASDITIGGPGLAGHALAAGLVDECHLFLHPVSVGGGTPALPLGVRVQFELLSERRFASGAVHLRYRVTS
jgi:riboflavin biosynthesis pyrimidine reductase